MNGHVGAAVDGFNSVHGDQRSVFRGNAAHDCQHVVVEGRLKESYI